MYASELTDFPSAVHFHESRQQSEPTCVPPRLWPLLTALASAEGGISSLGRGREPSPLFIETLGLRHPVRGHIAGVGSSGGGLDRGVRHPESHFEAS